MAELVHYGGNGRFTAKEYFHVTLVDGRQHAHWSLLIRSRGESSLGRWWGFLGVVDIGNRSVSARGHGGEGWRRMRTSAGQGLNCTRGSNLLRYVCIWA